MAFGFGSGTEMMKSVQTNRSQLSKKRSLQDTHKQYNGVEDKDKPEFKKVSEQELRVFTEKFKKKQAKERRKNMILMGVVGIAILLSFYYILF